ncbi:hypothetical protein [Streptomyces sp. NRRL F-5630]|uniref:hypothetical protein n=1 Tax=Streptomyces sp. NRRL F-5630 TaxID=1463864 RepID=UPI003D71CEBE
MAAHKASRGRSLRASKAGVRALARTRAGTAEEVAAVIAFVAPDAASPVNDAD